MPEIAERDQRLTPKEHAFAKAFAATGDKRFALQEAGYAPFVQTADGMLRKPHVLAEIRRVQESRLFSEALPAAVDCLVEIIRGSRYPAGARVQASKVVMDRTLGAQDGGQAREPHEMTAEELAKAIEQLEREAAARAKGVTISQDPAPDGDVFA